MNKVTVFDASTKQLEFIRAAVSGRFTEMLYGGAIRGGKTYVLLLLAMLFAARYPGSRWAVVRKDLPTLRRNLLPTFNRIKGARFGAIKQDTWIIPCNNGSEIILFPASEIGDPDLNRWRGLEVNGVFIDELNEISEAAYHKAIERAGSWQVQNGKQPPPIVIGTCNPSDGWVKKDWYDPWKAGTLAENRLYIPAKITDNPHLDARYVENLKRLPAEIYRKFVEGDWEVRDDEFQIIPYLALRECLVAEENVQAEIAAREGQDWSLGIDVADAGLSERTDNSALVWARGNFMCESETMHGKRPDEVGQYAFLRCRERGLQPGRVGVDSLGVGAGTYGFLVSHGLSPLRVIAGEAPMPTYSDDPTTRALELQFADFKTQTWFRMRQDVLAGTVRVVDKGSLVQDLLSMRYMVTDRKLRCEPKDKVRKRLGRSPDEGDAAVICNWMRGSSVASPYVDPCDDDVAGEEDDEQNETKEYAYA